MIATIAAMKIMVEYIVGNVSKGRVVLLFVSVIAFLALL
jgi:phage-related holin